MHSGNRRFLEEETKDTDLSDLNASLSEVFNNTPADLNPDAEGKIGCYVRFPEGQLAAAKRRSSSMQIVLRPSC